MEITVLEHTMPKKKPFTPKIVRSPSQKAQERELLKAGRAAAKKELAHCERELSDFLDTCAPDKRAQLREAAERINKNYARLSELDNDLLDREGKSRYFQQQVGALVNEGLLDEDKLQPFIKHIIYLETAQYVCKALRGNGQEALEMAMECTRTIIENVESIEANAQHSYISFAQALDPAHRAVVLKKFNDAYERFDSIPAIQAITDYNAYIAEWQKFCLATAQGMAAQGMLDHSMVTTAVNAITDFVVAKLYRANSEKVNEGYDGKLRLLSRDPHKDERGR